MNDQIFFKRTAQLILGEKSSVGSFSSGAGFSSGIQTSSSDDRTALVLCGPVVGEVTETAANILLEIDVNATVTCSAHSASYPAVNSVKHLKAGVPEVFQLRGLVPDTKYRISFGPLADVQTKELQERGCTIRTMPEGHKLTRLRVIALSCDRPSQLKPGQENPWEQLASICKRDECDVMLHLGDQVYTKDRDWKDGAMRIMDVCEKPGIQDKVRARAEAEAATKLQTAYRSTWYPEAVASVLARSSHLMLWSDNDVANDFTVLKKKLADGREVQAYTPSFLRVGMRVYRMYQRQLWDPDCVFSQDKMEAMSDVEEWHFHRYGSCGIFMMDMRGNRIRPDGVQKEGPILHARQRRALEDAFGAQHGLTCMLVCAEIPFVGEPPDVIRQKVSKAGLTFLKDHWPYQIDELTWLLDLCFTWKAAARGREVILLGGDIHVSVDSIIKDAVTQQTIRSITTSPITNHTSGFFPKLTGSLNHRYTYEHRPLPGMRTYAMLDLKFSGNHCYPNVNIVTIPTEKDQQAAEKPQDVLVLCGPVIGKVTDTTANILLEIDETCGLTCTARPVHGGGEAVAQTLKLRKGIPEVFKLEGMQPATEYAISFDPLSSLQAEELDRRGCRVRTFPSASDIRKLRIVALSCDRPARMEEGQENPWGRLAKICKDGQCDVMLHLGDQVYTKEHDWKSSAMRYMDICEKPGCDHSLKLKMETEASSRLQEAYRATWYPEDTAASLSHSSHLMIWSDNDVANDFTILKKKDGTQAYTPSFLRVGMRVYTMYQRQLWDAECVTKMEKLEKQQDIEEWHFHRYGPCGIFLIDMRGNRIGRDGVQREGPLLSARQRSAIEKAFAEDGLTCMLVCSEIPFVGDPPDVIREKAQKLTFLKDHWPYQIDELTWLLDLCFAFKSSAPGREVIMLGGDIHVSVDSEIRDSKTGQSIRHITSSPITNHVCGFFPPLSGSLNDRYSYTHKVLPDVRTFCTLDLSFSGESVSADINVVQVPTK